jgi:anhydro-N-acetylmuramic acid kinase
VRVVGLMSGTSLDGIDACLLRLEGDSPEVLSWGMEAFATRPYGPEERALIQGTIENGSALELCRLHGLLGEWMAAAALDLLAGAGVAPGDVAAVGSHGQTVWHIPPGASGAVHASVTGAPTVPAAGPPTGRGFTLQLGDPATLAERTGIPVVSDFRARDLAAGGHGAPLVPWADRILLSRPGVARALQNLGGIGNVTWIPPRGSPEPTLAFDTGPGVVLLDAGAREATGGSWGWDRDGVLAAQGRVDDQLLARLMDDPFLREPPPRSTGREHFGPSLVRELAAERGLRRGTQDEGWPDLLATLTAFTAASIADAYRRWLAPRAIDEVVLAGGGALNPALVRAIAVALDPLPVRTGAEALGIDPDAREAAAFALMAWAHLKGIPANVPSATGSWGPRVLGSLTPGAGGRTG